VLSKFRLPTTCLLMRCLMLSILHTPNFILLKPHDELIQAMDKQKVTGLALLDLSFHTINHSILFHRQSTWFGIGDTARSWFSSYLSKQSFSIQCNGVKFSPSDLNTGVPQSLVLGPILFIMYTTPLSSLIFSHNTPSSLPIRHHLYADNSSFLSPHPTS